MTAFFAARARRASLLLRPLQITVLLLLALEGVSAQTSSTDNKTASGIAAGAGSQALSDLDSVNLYNGNLNLRLPLYQIAGRGKAQMVMMHALNTKRWRVKHTLTVNVNGDENHRYSPRNDSWGATPGYAPGVFRRKTVGINSTMCGGVSKYGYIITRMYFTTPDGSEYELRDQATGGQPLFRTSCTTGASRGTVFVSADGNAATYISDSTVFDRVDTSPDPTPNAPAGFLILRDGTRYRIDAGKVSWMRDRNGNLLSFGYDASARVTTITDSLNRQVTISYDVADVAPYGLCDRITFNGVGGAQRIIRVSKTNLGSALRPNSGFAVQTQAQLFPELNAASSTLFDPQVTSSVWMPDNKRFQFFYNSYGELARVVLPGGGAMEYDMTAGSGVVGPSMLCDDYQINRRVVERRVYPNGGSGSAYEGRITYAASGSACGAARPWTSNVVVDYRNPGGALLSREKHYFNGSALASLYESSAFYPYGDWNEAHEYQSEFFDSDGTTLLRRATKTIQQRAPVPWWGAWAAQNGLDASREPPNDTRVVESTTTLTDTNLVAKTTFGYDQYNNQTDVYVFGFGSGAPPTFPTRHVHTDFLTSNPVNGVNYATDTSIHLRSLIREQRVYSVNTQNGAETAAAYTRYEYDQFGLTARSGITGLDAGFTAGYLTRGNVTTVTQYADAAAAAGAVSSTMTYDVAGNLVSSTDARGQTTQVDYSDSFSDAVNRNTYAYPTSTTPPVPDPSAVFGSATPLVTTSVYDFATGLLISATDANGKTVAYEYNDPLNRPTRVTRPDGGWTQYNYDTALNAGVSNDYVRTLTALDGARSVESYRFHDGLGRLSRTFLNEGGSPVVFSTTDTQYDALGRAWRVSQPYRT
ncbi:MAG TPA: RHS repeat domain-containing protein, partial [Pyrinomonadaceae bacterium]